jgi:hypothetical protein
VNTNNNEGDTGTSFRWVDNPEVVVFIKAKPGCGLAVSRFLATCALVEHCHKGCRKGSFALIYDLRGTISSSTSLS